MRHGFITNHKRKRLRSRITRRMIMIYDRITISTGRERQKIHQKKICFIVIIFTDKSRTDRWDCGGEKSWLDGG